MVNRQQRQLYTLLFILSLLSITSSLALPAQENALTLPSPPFSHLPTPPRHNTITSSHNPSTHPLLRRQVNNGYQRFLNLGAGWNMYYSSWHAIALPVQLASLDLVRLYSTIIANAAGVWRVALPRYVYPSAKGDVETLILLHVP